ncbi:hypothetical protein GUITHDRAFT_137038 [Guillardia theta CCMP2712]|uniref:Uncharacterized protein n=1 Tax=Guillardia theta (strain CCMP2712) TaxID=905079 RepID=L1JID7_GUITC|nr:hypothetical protein GUITHDRAFT_137038 [Guillardia theta CCMP2712]EKX48092.1 hypothetical protein GUITHDRAFT_137038 [Guillardia theta CCMP2712]|eukprot:XP_005835072.1 hypothetical protein GUITHDRAFT_137038 [Guillardia theta CCMP2712]
MATKAGFVRLLGACAMLALPTCSLYLESDTASSHSTHTRNLAFIQPCSPRLSRHRAGREAISKSAGAETCMLSGRHLGPTIDEIREIRFQEEKQIQASKFDSRECQENAEDGLVAYSGQDKGPQRRHLGPTLEEVLEIKRLARDRGFSQRGPNDDDCVESNAHETDPNSPSQEQIKVLKNYGISIIPSTKIEASLLIREMRDMQIAERFGLSTLNK